MNRSGLIRRVSRKAQVRQSKIEEILDAVIDTIETALRTGDVVMIKNFGRFEVREREERVWRNPLSGEEMKVPPKRALLFHPAPAFKEHVQ